MRHSHLVGALISAFVLAFASLSSAQNTVQRVDPQLMTELNDGSSWPNAFQTLDRALDPVFNLQIQTSFNVELHLKAGTYIPDGSLTYPPGSLVTRETAFVVPNGVLRIRGSFKGTEAVDKGPIGSPTILSGDIGTLGASGDNCYRVLPASVPNRQKSGRGRI